MKKLLVGAGLSIVGIAAVLTWWTVHPAPSHLQSSNKIPASVWGGGPTKITLETESSTPVTMSITFADHSKPAGEQPILETAEKTISGIHSWSVSVPNQVGGYIEVEAQHPKAGDWLKWKVGFNGHVVKEEKETLDKDLEPKTAFFLQLHLDDYSKALDEMQEVQPTTSESPEDN
ncbi:MAG TPA: hypothetical protein VKT53_04830 [Candidatus Acidoferrum sp.]|nr:hypothetical protein [Candidatus Acidoferrum sp.]